MTLDYAPAPAPPADASYEPCPPPATAPNPPFRGDPSEAGKRGHPTGPRTSEGKETSSSNAVTHGLFARETVLPQHGEDPAEYTSLLDELTQDLRPQNLLERHCVQTIAAALWRLRRFHQWNAQLDTNDELTPDDRLKKMERAQRAETTLHRRINAALQMLGRDLSELLHTRARLPRPGADNTQKCQNEPLSSPLPGEAAPVLVTGLSPVPTGERWRSRIGGQIRAARARHKQRRR